MIEIRVIGTPAPQGSKKHVGNGIMIESSKAVKPWREAVKWAALEACTRGRACEEWQKDHGNGRVSGPILAEMTFTMRRPKSAKKNAVPATRPDLSKLIRSTEDALTEAGTWEDDARVVECVARKVYPGEHPDALDVPGAVIRVRSIATQAARDRGAA